MGVFMILSERLQRNYQHFILVHCKILEIQSSISVMSLMTCQNYLKMYLKTMNKCSITNENVSCGGFTPFILGLLYNQSNLK